MEPPTPTALTCATPSGDTGGDSPPPPPPPPLLPPPTRPPPEPSIGTNRVTTMIAVAGSHSVLMTEGWAGRGAAGEGDNRPDSSRKQQ
jgi:hypothetical protein